MKHLLRNPLRHSLSTTASVASVVLTSMTLVAIAPTTTTAQAPRITPQGDPSVRADTIYRLAVKPEDHPEDASAFLLDDGVVRLEADGRYTKTFRQIVQVLKEDAVDGLQEHSFGYEPGHQKLTVNWIRVVKPSGEVVSAKPTQMQESAVPAEMGNPVYSDTKVIRASLSGVAVGTIVDYSYTLEELKPMRKNDFYAWWGISTGLAVARSRYIVDAPSALPLLIHERNLNFTRHESTSGDRKTYVWATRDLPRIKPEPYAADSNNVYMSVALSAPGSWNDIGAWYAGLARDRYTLGPAAESRVSSLVRNAKTREDSIRAVHKWVAQDIRYVSIDLGVGGYQPRKPDTVVATGFGDCKDKATLFVAALGKLGITAYPVLLNSSAHVDRSLPSKDQFDHAIAAVTKPGGGYTYADMTSDITPFGELPYSEQDQFGLVVHPDGQTEEITFPATPLTANFSHDSIVGHLDADGTLDMRYVETVGGASAPQLRRLFMTPMDSATRGKFTRALAGQLYTGATGDSLVGFDGKDLAAATHVSLHMHKSQAISHSAGTDILPLPVGAPVGMVNVANEIESLPTRQFSIDALKVVGPITNVMDMSITLPAGWKAHVPRTVRASSAFGTYVSEYSQVGQEFRLSRSLTGARGILPPDHIRELVSWMRTVGADDAQFLVLDRPSTAVSAAH